MSSDSLFRSAEGSAVLAPAQRALKVHRLSLLISVYRRAPSTRAIVYAYLGSLFPLQLWSIFHLLREIPAWLGQMTVWDVVGVASYVQMFALVESVVIFLPLVFLAMVLPAAWFKDKFLALSTGFVYVSVVWFTFAHIYDATIWSWGYRQFLPWIGLFLSSQILFYFRIQASRNLESVIVSFVERVAFLSAVYFLFGLLSVAIIVVRNI
jgi:hypothetical protein